MKKIIIILGLILSVLISYGQKENFLEIGYEDYVATSYNQVASYQDKQIIVDKVNVNVLKNSLYGNLQCGYNYKGIVAYTSVKTNFIAIKLDSYRPLYVRYNIGLKYSYNIFEIKFEHMCGHGVDEKNIRESYDKISLKIKF